MMGNNGAPKRTSSFASLQLLFGRKLTLPPSGWEILGKPVSRSENGDEHSDE